MLREHLKKHKDRYSRQLLAQLDHVGPDLQGVVKIAAMVATGRLRRVLMFQDPDDVGIDHPGNYALLRNCNLSGSKLYINAAANLWALYECKKNGIRRKWPYITTPVTTSAGVKETVALIAHDGEKQRLARFVVHHREILRRFPRLIATSGTKRFIDEFQVIHLPPWDRVVIEPAANSPRTAHGPSGGDVVIADEIFSTYSVVSKSAARDRKLKYYSFYTVLFFADHRSVHPHEPDIQVLLRTCVNPLNRVNLILNSRMAEEWAERYR